MILLRESGCRPGQRQEGTRAWMELTGVAEQNAQDCEMDREQWGSGGWDE